jgi:hypothetical protein
MATGRSPRIVHENKHPIDWSIAWIDGRIAGGDAPPSSNERERHILQRDTASLLEITRHKAHYTGAPIFSGAMKRGLVKDRPRQEDAHV